jgi:putative zinc finger protein
MTHVHEDLGAYVLGALPEDESAAVHAHLEGCAECRARHEEIAGLPGLLNLAAVSGKHDLVPLAPALEERVLDSFAREVGDIRPRRSRRPRRLPRRWMFASGGAFAAAAAAVTLFVVGLGSAGPAVAYRLHLRGTGAAPQAGATAALQPVTDGTRVRLKVWSLPGDPAAVYEVRCEAPGWSASAGTFHVDSHGNAYVVLTTAARQGEYDYIRVVRHDRGPAGQSRMANVLAGRIS